MFAHFVQGLILQWTEFYYTILGDGLDITKLLIDFGVHMALAIPALYIALRFDPKLFDKD